MEKQRLNFFLICPSCKRKFGVKPEVVFKYLRLLEETKKELKRRVEKVRKREPLRAPSLQIDATLASFYLNVDKHLKTGLAPYFK